LLIVKPRPIPVDYLLILDDALPNNLKSF
jgi:hypothetical protein